jgi:NAD(P)H-dependent flavin oxidoreductase YrpB (nitropropane dioxygenase family)
MSDQFNYQQPLRVGVAGGLGSPQALMAAQDLGAAYFVLGSVHQSCLEAGLSTEAKELLAKASQAWPWLQPPICLSRAPGFKF